MSVNELMLIQRLLLLLYAAAGRQPAGIPSVSSSPDIEIDPNTRRRAQSSSIRRPPAR